MDRSFFRFLKIHEFDRQTDGQTEFSSPDRVCIPCNVVISGAIFSSQLITLSTLQGRI